MLFQIYTLTEMLNLRTRASIASRAVRGCIAGHRFWANRPANAFTREGYEVIDGFLSRAECDRLVALAAAHLPGPSHRVAGNCYTWVKAESAHGRNRGVRELLNVDDLDDGVARLMANRDVHALFEARLGERVEMYGFSIQFDDIDTTSKRGFHIDVYTPPLFKVFIYLNDVLDEGDGPYTIVPGSHRWSGRRLVNDFANAVTSAARRDMRYLVNDSDARTVLAPAGTAILSTQDAVHKGWSNHWRTPRHVLIGYATPARYFRGGPLTEGVETLNQPGTNGKLRVVAQ
jgi:hypothetical protein